MPVTGESLGDAFPKMQAHLRKLLSQYREIGPAGTFGATMIEHALQRADTAAASGNAIAMIRSYKEMEGFK